MKLFSSFFFIDKYIDFYFFQVKLVNIVTLDMLPLTHAMGCLEFTFNSPNPPPPLLFNNYSSSPKGL